ncbi:MAG: hypothetical protein QM223_07610 [Bacteroidota bacterium]|nr:hypothetical protein [Bacteroidota bacterium]HHU00115.1 hypothetical protein [Bacteroidales bacterium]
METVRYLSIKDNAVLCDGKEVLYLPGEDFPSFAKTLYKESGAEYPKFYKMSDMCKLGFLAAEFLLKDLDEVKVADPDQKALVLGCRASSLHADIEYSRTMNDIPSPALFVYTLANIVSGEIAIRHCFRGEELMLVQDGPESREHENYLKVLMAEGKTKFCISGFVDYDENGNYIAELSLIKKK